MFINLITFVKSFYDIDTIASCDYCGALWAITEDEIQIFKNQKNDNEIKGFTCPNCEKQLILPF